MSNTLFNEINPYIRYVNRLVDCNNSNHVVPWRTLYDYEIIFVTRGQITVQNKTGKFVVKENQFHIMSPNVEHTRYFENGDSCDYFNIHLDLFYDSSISDFSAKDVYVHPDASTTFNNLETRKKRVTPTLINVVTCFSPTKTTALFDKLLSAYRNTSIIYKQLLLKSICLQIINELVLSCDKSSVSILNTKLEKNDDLIHKFIDFVESNYKFEINVPLFVSDKGISINHFIKIFKEKKSMTPNEFIIQYRINQAKMLIDSGLYYIYEIAEMVGYPNEFYFSRIFKKREGCSPAQYQKRAKKKINM